MVPTSLVPTASTWHRQNKLLVPKRRTVFTVLLQRNKEFILLKIVLQYLSMAPEFRLSKHTYKEGKSYRTHGLHNNIVILSVSLALIDEDARK